MSKVALGWALSLTMFGCAGSQPPAKAECPSGTMLKAGSCVPLSDEEAEARIRDSEKGDPSNDDVVDAGPKTPYDKKAADIMLKRAATQVKENCGHSKDENGKAGPWGKSTVKVTLGRNGRSSGVSMPAPFEGSPAGKCVEKAFTGLIIPPYAAPEDSVVEWDIEVDEPGKKKPAPDKKK